MKSKDSIKTLYHTLKAAHRIIAANPPHFKRKTAGLNKLVVSVSLLKVKPAVLQTQKSELAYFFLCKIHALALFRTLQCDQGDGTSPAYQLGSTFSEAIALAEVVPVRCFRVARELLDVLDAFAESCPTSIAFKKLFEANVLRRLSVQAMEHTQRRSLALLLRCLRNLRGDLQLPALQRLLAAMTRTVQGFENMGAHAGALAVVRETVRVLEEQSEAFETLKELVYAEVLLSVAVAMGQYVL